MGFLLTGTAIGGFAHANPQGGEVVGGSATLIETESRLDIHQHTDRTVIDWRSFDIAVDETTQFHQPNSNSIAVNRVNSPDPSRIAGQLSANGNIILVNPNGVFFEGSARVDVNGLIATTANINPQNFMDGSNHFDQAGNPNAAIINSGQITAKEAGLVGLVAPNVENNGIIQAKMGRVQLASGDTVVADFYGDDLLKIEVTDEAIESQIVANSGVLSADGGTVAMTAAAAKQTINSLIVADGVLGAQTINQENGVIIIGGEGSNKTEKSGDSFVAVTGIVDASGRDDGEQGGSVEILGDHIALTETAFIDASGYESRTTTRTDNDGSATMTEDRKVYNGVRSEEDFLAHDNRTGGSVKIGGDYLGQGDTQTAKTLQVDRGAVIINDAIQQGDGGRTILWSDDTTEFSGLIVSRGGAQGGHGGFVETSGKINLKATGDVDLTNRADGYNKGTYLLDPTDITIYGNVDPRFVSTDSNVDLNSDLALWLDTTDATQIFLTYSTDGLGTTASGTIGTNTITSVANVSSNLAVGSRIRLGGAGAVTAANVSDADTYTITAISGTNITVSDPLTRTYTGSTLHRGLVSEWRDKSNNSHHVFQNVINDMPLWINDGFFAMDYSGNRYLERGDALGLTGAASISAFLPNLPLGVGEGRYIYLGSANATGGQMVSLSTGDGSFRYNNGNSVHADGTPNGTDLFLNTFVREDGATYAGSNVRFFRNSLQVASTSATNAGSVLNMTDEETVIGASAVAGSVNPDRFFNSLGADVIIYSNDLDINAQQLVEQYTATKFAIELNPLDNSESEVDQATDSTNGYSVFNASYLERLSASADIILQADNSITFDLQGDTLALDTGRNLSLTTNTGTITDVGAMTGTVRTDNGNISITAGGAGNITLDNTNLEATNGGVVNLDSVTGDVSLTQASSLNLGLVTGNAITIESTAGDIQGRGGVVSSGGAIDITASGDINFANIGLRSSNGNIALDGGQDVTLTTSTNSGTGDVSVTAGRDISIQEHDLSTNLINYWGFDENMGTSVTDSVNSRVGNFVNDTAFSSDNPFGITNFFSTEFDGGDDQIDFGDYDDIELTDVTFSFWARTDSTDNNDDGFLYKGNHASNQPFLIWRDGVVGGGSQSGNTDAIGVIVYDGSTQDWIATPTGSFNTTDWRHMTVTLNPTNNLMNVYLDGKSQFGEGFVMNSNGIRANGNEFTAGLGLNNQRDLEGNMDDLRIYDTALAAPNVAEIYAFSPQWNTDTIILDAGRNVSINNNLTSPNNIDIDAGGSITATGSLTSDDNGISLDAVTGININNQVRANGGAGGIVAINNTTSGDITIGGQLRAGDSITVNNMGGNIDVSGSIRSSRNGIDFDATGTITARNGLRADNNSSGVVDINAMNDAVNPTIFLANTIRSGRDVGITLHDNVQTTGSVATLSFQTGNLTANGFINANDRNLTFRSRIYNLNGGTDSVSNSNNNRSISLSGWGNSDSFVFGGSGGDARIPAAQLDAINFDSFNNVIIGAGGVTDFVRVDTDLAANANIRVLTDGSSPVDVNGSLTSTRNNGTIRIDTSTLTIGDNIITTSGSDGDIDINANDVITIDGTNVQINAGTGFIDIATGGAHEIITNGELTVTTDELRADDNFTGDLTWLLTGDPTASIVNSTGSNITVAQGTAANSIDIGSVTDSGDIGISSAVVSSLNTNFENITFGRSDGGAIVNYTTSFNDDLSILSNSTFTNQADLNVGTNTVNIQTSGNIILNHHITSASTATNAIVISTGDNFINNAGAAALNASDTSARWLVYSSNPASNTLGGLSPAFKRYNHSFTGNAPSTITETGNGLLYSIAPVLTYDVADASVEYGETLGALTSSFLSGLIDGDTLATIGQSGTQTLSSSYTVGDNAGTYATSLTGAIGTLSNPLGYQYAFNAGDLMVTQANLDVSIADSPLSRNQGAVNPAFILNYSGFKLGENESVIDTAPAANTIANLSSPAGLYDILLSGGADVNYSFNFINGVLDILALVSPGRGGASSLIPSTVEQDFVAKDTVTGIDFLIPESQIELADNKIEIEIEGTTPSPKKSVTDSTNMQTIKLTIEEDLVDQLNF